MYLYNGGKGDQKGERHAIVWNATSRIFKWLYCLFRFKLCQAMLNCKLTLCCNCNMRMKNEEMSNRKWSIGVIIQKPFDFNVFWKQTLIWIIFNSLLSCCTWTWDDAHIPGLRWHSMKVYQIFKPFRFRSSSIIKYMYYNIERVVLMTNMFRSNQFFPLKKECIKKQSNFFS